MRPSSVVMFEADILFCSGPLSTELATLSFIEIEFLYSRIFTPVTYSTCEPVSTDRSVVNHDSQLCLILMQDMIKIELSIGDFTSLHCAVMRAG